MHTWLKTYTWIGLLVFLVLQLLMAFFLSLRLIWNEPSFIAQVSAQQTRSQRLAKNALLLATEPSQDERAQIISQLQRALPNFERVQNGLLTGDAEIGLPRNIPEHIQLAVRQARPSFVAIVAATRIILDNPDSLAISIQIQIILSQENEYDQRMSIVNTLWQERIDQAFDQVAWIALSLLIGSTLLMLSLHFGIILKSLSKLSLQERTIATLTTQIEQHSLEQEAHQTASQEKYDTTPLKAVKEREGKEEPPHEDS